jgi:hypothetical protein
MLADVAIIDETDLTASAVVLITDDGGKMTKA